MSLMKNNLPATKADLKSEIAKLVTKKEFKAQVAKLATKEELKRTELAIRKGAQLDFEDFRKEINEKLNLLPTKDEFFTRMDKVMGELQTIREEQLLLSAKSSSYGDRLTVLEQKTGIATPQQ